MCLSRFPVLQSQFSVAKYTRCQVVSSSTISRTIPILSHAEMTSSTPGADCNGNSLHNHFIEAACSKKVRFADTEGLDLVRVRDIPQNNLETPPDIQRAVIRANPGFPTIRYDGACSAIVVNNERTFTIDFPQPVSDITSFMRRIEEEQVCLESAQVTNGRLIGTIKVRNLAFHKTVFVRLSADYWRTIQNIEAHYVNNADGAAGARSALAPHHNLVDTFSFEYDLNACSNQSSAHLIQFAICFQCKGSEFWDNNRGKNYQISVHSKGISNTTSPESSSNAREKQRSDFTDGYNVSWSEYAIWNHIDDLTPYW